MASVFKRGSDRRCKGSKWIVRWHDAEAGKRRQMTGYTDKQASLSMGERLEKESARRAEGIADPFDEHRRRPIGDHVADYVDRLRAGNRHPRTIQQVRNRITRVAEGTGSNRISDFDPAAVLRFLADLRVRRRPISCLTKNEYIGTLKSFTKWAVESRRVEVDPLASLKRIERRVASRTHPRRALSLSQLGRLLRAAEQRPLLEVRKVRTGPNKGKPVADVRPAVARKKQRLGQERRLVYLLAYWAGLRRGEIKQLTWDDIDLDVTPPRIRLRAETTKSRRADVQVIHPQLEESLRQLLPKTVRRGQSVVSTVPDMKTIRADLRMADIEPGSRELGYVDLHSLRMSLSTAMAAGGLSPRVRQAHMRHTDPRLTNNTYVDEALLPVADELTRMPWIPSGTDEEKQPIRLPATGTEAGGAGPHAANMQQMCGAKGQFAASPGRSGSSRRAGRGSTKEAGPRSQTPVNARDGKTRQGPASSDTGPCKKRAMRFELTTFTLAMRRRRIPTATKSRT